MDPVERVRAIALALPETEEYEHGDQPAFRVRGKRFATMLDADGVNLMLGEDGIRAAVALWPEACTARWFAQRLAAVRVAHTVLDTATLEELVTDAWAARAPKRLVAEYRTGAM
jgi:hypothetical protein